MIKEQLLPFAVKQLTRMNLTVLISNIDYRGLKPDLVVVYPDKDKYYMTEVIAKDTFASPSPAFKALGPDAGSRDFCRKLYDDYRTAVWAASIYCDLGHGVEVFGYSELNGLNFNKMQKYASIIYPSSLNSEAEIMFNKFELMHRSINVSEIFTLTLFSYADTIKLAESRRFMQFLASNKQLAR